MKDYLLDTNHVSAWENQSPTFMSHLAAAGTAKLIVCAITVGELDAGHRMTGPSKNQARRDSFEAFVVRNLHPHVLPLTLRTRISYAEIVGRIWSKHHKRTGVGTERHLADLGVDINDIWTVAVAFEHNLTLLTTDAMTAIRSVLTPAEVTFNNWC